MNASRLCSPEVIRRTLTEGYNNWQRRANDGPHQMLVPVAMKIFSLFIVWSIASLPCGAHAATVPARRVDGGSQSRQVVVSIHNSADPSSPSSQLPGDGCAIASCREEEDSFEEDLVAATTFGGCEDHFPGPCVYVRPAVSKHLSPCTFLMAIPLRC